MAYKKSKYNILVERPEGSFLWNTFSNAFIKLSPEGKTWLEDFDGTQLSGTYFQILKDNGCLVDTDLNETGRILYEEKTVMLDPEPEELHFTVAPGLGCNYHCRYCFENGHVRGETMNSDDVRAVETYIMDRMDEDRNLKRLSIRWFGGEPLLYLDTIEKMSRTLMEQCTRRGVEYTAGIVTNGRLLTREAAGRLKRLRVGYVQLSMDGMEEYYEKQKGAAPGDFSAVVNNLMDTADILDITVRINITDSLAEAEKLTEYLLKDCGLEGKIKIYVAHVRDYEGRSAAKEQASHAEYLKLEGRYNTLFQKPGPYSANSLSTILPKRRCTTCKTVCGPNCCIGPKGELYRCEHHYGQKGKEVGNVRTGRYFSKTEIGYLTYRHPEKCLECQLLPVCLGGCMNDNGNGIPVLACREFQERQIDYLIREYLVGQEQV